MKQLRMQFKLVISTLVIVLCLGISPSAGASTQGNSWEFAAEVYLWGASIGGETASGSDVKIDFGDLLDNLEMAFMGAFKARKNNWSFVADVIYLDVKGEGSVDNIGASVELRGWVVTPDVGYTVLNGDRGHLDLHVGLRYLYLESDIRLGPDGIDASDDIWDGIVGIRGRINLTEKLYLPYYLDIGTGDSEMTWQASAGLGYQFKHFDIVAGYRYLEWDFDDSPVFDNLDFNGPYAGIKFLF